MWRIGDGRQLGAGGLRILLRLLGILDGGGIRRNSVYGCAYRLLHGLRRRGRRRVAGRRLGRDIEHVD